MAFRTSPKPDTKPSAFGGFFLLAAHHHAKGPGRRSQAGARLLCYIIRVIVAAPGRGCACANRRGVDPPRKYLPRKRIPPNLRSLARAHTELGVKVLAGIASAEDAPPAARVSAAQALLDRGWGKPAQPHTGEDGEIRVTLRTITEGKP